MKKDFNCILCPYKKEEDCLEKHSNCYSLSNIYWGTLVKHFPFKQIDWIKDKIEKKHSDNRWARLEKRYGDVTKEDDTFKFIWGYPNSEKANLYTMNDIDIVYDKKEQKYLLGIETAYFFSNSNAEVEYLEELLEAFAEFMRKSGFNLSYSPTFFMSNPVISAEADSIEELYWNFKIFVLGYKNSL